MLNNFLCEYFSPENTLNIEMYTKYYDEKIAKTIHEDTKINQDFFDGFFLDFNTNTKQVIDLFSKLKNK